MSDDLKKRLQYCSAYGTTARERIAATLGLSRIAELEAQLAAETTSSECCREDARALESCAPFDELQRQNELLEAQLKAAREALEFYRDAFQFVPRRTKTGIDLSIWRAKDALLEDCGERAIAALDPKPTATGETP